MLVIVGMIVLITCAVAFLRPSPVDFSSQVKPILNKKCITCHGGVRAKAGFSVLFREEALAATESGKPAIIPGDPGSSEMIRRITSNDEEERMPYKHEPLSHEEIKTLKRWIREGAKWGDHWAYLPVKQTAVPGIEDPWVKNDIDKYILQKLNGEKITPSSEAPKATLLRRVSLDLIGIYPSDSICRNYLQNNSGQSYEILVDSLLASPQFGERWTSMWLDLARYADTKGYESDGGRSIWQYRDWVIKAFNEDMPYDRFLTAQIAGDLLPGASGEDFIATAFHRNTMTNDEGGTDNEEFRVAAVTDRVNTTWEAIMGTTFSCVQCHSHPYDPFKHDEYYKFLAYFNNTRDEDIDEEFPVMRQFTDTMQRQLNDLSDWVSRHSSKERSQQIEWLIRTHQPAINSTTADSLVNAVIILNNHGLLLRNHSIARIRNMDLSGNDQFIWQFYSQRKGGKLTFRKDSIHGPVIAVYTIKPSANWQYGYTGFSTQQGVHDIYLSYENSLMPKGKYEDGMSFGWIAASVKLPGKGTKEYSKYHDVYRQLLEAPVPGTPIMLENPANLARKTQVFERGNFRTPGKEVTPAVPAALQYAMPENAPANRAGLAQWITSDKNPLVARTIVNRLWEQLFGTGIVETLEDMGTQGIAPTHQQLLDYLSYRLVHEYRWSLKSLLKEMVMSATYRQDSRLTDEIKEKDFFNRFYARGARVRLTAEQVRDQALQASGKLSVKMFGKPVMPWQPDGIWLSPYNDARWEKSTGEDQYRRAIYTYWKRSSPYPSMISFDGAQRNVCSARRIRTNTPLQALVTLNDSAYLDLSRQFAFRMKKVAGQDPAKQIATGYTLLLYRNMPAAKLELFLELYDKALKDFRNDKDRTCEMTGLLDENNNPQTAALVVVANAMLNLDEVIMKN
ncbi:hypothetical protein OI18_08420 [Flavihumibacter solisilvae]|uniref:Cytochrome c domain-containing protein n=1 Tax=Flavihumibacter solisilvae TaxID=1349421 RepID=A0A0C1L4N9_9BACT|nr:hypothetical protein OI18_08420 [Flavihumibacter solisilvae]